MINNKDHYMTNKDRKQLYQYILSYLKVLPCQKCRYNADNEKPIFEDFDNMDTANIWLVRIYNVSAK